MLGRYLLVIDRAFDDGQSISLTVVKAVGLVL